jgi:hypothetical protein
MRHNRLKLVVPDNGAATNSDGPTELSAVTRKPDSGIRRLRLVEADEGAPPDDAA